MNVDRKQFNRSEWTYEEVERQIQLAKRLRSEAIAQYAQRLAVVVANGVRRLSNGLRGEAQRGVGAVNAWAPAATVPVRVVARCK